MATRSRAERDSVDVVLDADELAPTMKVGTLRFSRERGASGHIEEDLAQLFRRVVFNVLVSNRDDHLRNHGCLRTRSDWRLAPAYDLNPNLEKQEHALTLDETSAEPRIDTVLETAEFYRLTSTRAQRVISQLRCPYRKPERGMTSSR